MIQHFPVTIHAMPVRPIAPPFYLLKRPSPEPQPIWGNHGPYAGMIPTPKRPKFFFDHEGGMFWHPGSYFGWHSAMPVPPRPCFGTLANCRFGQGSQTVDGDDDFDDGFNGFGVFLGFLGPYGYSPLGYGSTCILNGMFQNCFLSPVLYLTGGFPPYIYSPFSGAFGYSYNNYGYGAYGYFGGNDGGTGLMYANGGTSENSFPQQETAPLNNAFTGEIFEPPPAPYAGELPPPNPPEGPVTVLVLNDGIEFGVTSYWMKDGQLCYVTTYNVEKCIAMRQVDLQKTVDINYKRGISFTLAPAPQASPENPHPNLQQPPRPQENHQTR